MKHTPYIHRADKELRWSRDFGCYIIIGEGFAYSPNDYYLGERWVYTRPGYDCNRACFRGNLSDDWPCHDFGQDFLAALEWLHCAEEDKERTMELWTK